MIRCGDTVYHKPTKETWIVAYADYDHNELAWCGWPEGFAKLSDCELKESCSDEEHLEAVARWKKPYKSSHRRGMVEHLYLEAWSQA